METKKLEAELSASTYPGRGIVLGTSEDGKHAVIAYFIMGRSDNSRNRIFVPDGKGIRTRAYDESKMEDPSLIIYAPVRVFKNQTIVTNGDQTDTIYHFLQQGKSFEDALRTRTFEPDAPNLTPRVSGLVDRADKSYRLSILKSACGDAASVRRFFFEYSAPRAGEGHFIHTYSGDGNPLPSFEGEPAQVQIPGDIDCFTDTIWRNLHQENKVSLFTRFIHWETGEVETRIINKNCPKLSPAEGGFTANFSFCGGTEDAMAKELLLKYGCNPNQKPSRIFMKDESELPITVLNGRPGYINFMDALNSWQLVKELKKATGLPAAASFKHVSPAGAAVGLPLSDTLRKIYFVDDLTLSPIASAYARARGADRMSSYGDWAALSDPCDRETALLLAREVSDGIIAPGYTQEALEILKTKRKGSYNIVRINPDYIPAPVEHKDIFGITFEQGRNDVEISDSMLRNIVTQNKDLPDGARRDLLISLITLKYTQSNSVCYAKDGQVIGVGAGQQSRIHCTRLAGNKADFWHLRQHPKVLGLKFREGIRRPDRDNTIDVYISDEYMDVLADGVWESLFAEKPEPLTREEKRAWLDTLMGVSIGSDAFFPFGDNIERAHKTGVQYIAEPGGSIRDDNVIATCNKYNIVMAFTGQRLFHH